MQQFRHFISLITVSLVLLAVFLFWFLKNSYEQEIASLQKETGYLFVNSVQGMEGEMMDKFLFQSADDIPEKLRKGLVDKRISITADSIKSFSFVGESFSHSRKDTMVQVTVVADNRPGKVSELEGSLSIFLAMEDWDEMQDSNFMHNHVSDILDRMEKKFSSRMAGANLPVEYKIVKLHADTAHYHELLGSGTYTDLVSGEKYGVELSGFSSYIMQKIWPQILLSLGLFACVSFAFFTIIKSLKAQQHLTELKNDFIRNVTHELKTPIATVGVAIEALQDFDAIKDPERTKEYLDISKNELNRLSLLVDKVLRMSLFEKTAPELKLEPVQLDGLVDEVLSSMKLQFDKKNAKVHFEKSGDGFELQGDRIHLTSVVYNLVDNALKYSNGDTKIDLCLEEKEGALSLSVSDNGQGIPSEYQDKIFEKFFRVPTGNRHNVKGHGLGLSYVASVVQKHGGTIALQSEEGQGTTFTIKF